MQHVETFANHPPIRFEDSESEILWTKEAIGKDALYERLVLTRRMVESWPVYVLYTSRRNFDISPIEERRYVAIGHNRLVILFESLDLMAHYHAEVEPLLYPDKVDHISDVIARVIADPMALAVPA